MRLNIKIALIAFAFVIASVSARAGSHINLSSEPSDYSDEASFLKMCTEYNSELPNVETVCQGVAASYFPENQ